MKALVYTAPDTVAYRDEPDPQAGPGDAIVRIEAVGVCGSDMHAFHGHDPRRVPPLILGHEAAGTVVQGGHAGRRVVLNPLITCMRCDDCLGGRSNLCRDRQLIGMTRPGAFAERIAIPEINLIPLPDGMEPVHAAVTEPAATALHAVNLLQRAAHRPVAEARALVLGGGSIGLLAALILKRYGCRDILLGDTNPMRRETAALTRACEVYDPAADEDVPGNDAFDVVVDAVGGASTRKAATSAVRPGGVITHVGLMDNAGELDVRKMTLAEITFVGTYTYTAVDLRAAVTALHRGALGSLDWIEQRPLADGLTAFRDLDRGHIGAAKIVLRPHLSAFEDDEPGGAPPARDRSRPWRMEMSAPDFLVHDRTDTVGVVVVENVKAGQNLVGLVMEDGTNVTVTALDDIPLGHKIALRDFAPEETVVKYGHDIGQTAAPIKKGQHLHVHNAKTKRW